MVEIQHTPRRAILVSNEANERIVRGVHLMPWRSFFAALWAGDIVR